MSDRQLDWDAIRARIHALKGDSTQAALAERAGVDKATLSRFLSPGSTKQISADTVHALAAHFAVSETWLLTGAEPAPPAARPDQPSAANAVRADTADPRPAPPTHNANAGVVGVPITAIDPWAKNPRKNFDEAAIDDLAASLREQAAVTGGAGVLQNLVVRPHPDAPGRYLIVAGERRWRAAMLNARDGDATGPEPTLPCLVRDLDDAEALKIALTENIDRESMSPMEEARGLAELQRIRAAAAGAPVSAAEIAREVGKQPRFVQLRLALVEKLAPEAQRALEQGAISLQQARVLTAVPAEVQIEALPEIEAGGWGYETAEQTRLTLLDDLPLAGWALFDLDAYRAEGGELFEDEDGGADAAVCTNRPLFDRLQDAAIAARKAALERKWTRVILHNERVAGAFARHRWNDNPDEPDAAAVIVVRYDGRVEILEGLSEKPDTSRTDGGGLRWTGGTGDAAGDSAGEAAPPKRPSESVTKGHAEHAHRRKTQAMQKRVAERPMVAVRAAAFALLTRHCSEIAIGPTEIHHWSRAAHPDVEAAAAAGCKTLGVDAFGRPRRLAEGGGDPAAVWRELVDMPDDAVMALFAALVARQVGTRPREAQPGDTPLAIAIADTLDIPGAEEDAGLAEPQEGDLDGLRRPALEAIAGALGFRDTERMKTGELRAAIARRTGRAEQSDAFPVDAYVIPTFRFGEDAELAAWIDAGDRTPPASAGAGSAAEGAA